VERIQGNRSEQDRRHDHRRPTVRGTVGGKYPTAVVSVAGA
jgi:hypothetical protein